MLRKKDILFLASIVLALCVIAVVSVLPAQAMGSATFGFAGSTATPGGPCAGVDFIFGIGAQTNADTSDGGSEDFYSVDVTDGNGNVIAVNNSFVPYNLGSFSAYVTGNMMSVTAKPLTVRFWDTDASWNHLGAPLMIHVVDPATLNSACASLPFGSSTAAGGSTCSADGRINSDDCAGPVALYCDGDELQVYSVDPDSGEGWLAFTFSDWPATTPAVNKLLASHGSTELWHLSSGEFQINADQAEGKTYAFIFNGCPYDGGGYHANLDPNE